jgi:hypothetical protein
MRQNFSHVLLVLVINPLQVCCMAIFPFSRIMDDTSHQVDSNHQDTVEENISKVLRIIWILSSDIPGRRCWPILGFIPTRMEWSQSTHEGLQITRANGQNTKGHYSTVTTNHSGSRLPQSYKNPKHLLS